MLDEWTVDRRYLSLPVRYGADVRVLSFYRGGERVLDLDVAYDPESPDTRYYADMARFSGETLRLELDPPADLTGLFLTDDVPEDGLYREPLRPRTQFTAARGWLNDPNGPVWYEGLYHLFFQYNPVGNIWGNMHWGHAVSRDLLRWEEREIALFPDEMGTMFSGCAVVDEDNRTGLAANGHAPLLLYYTAAGGTSRLSRGRVSTQCLAYSVDGGRTFRKYPGNPVIDTLRPANRDPKVTFDPGAGVYRLALYLEADRFALFASEDLLHWRMTQELELPGDAECPDLYPLPDETGEVYWVFTGASARYWIGRFENGLFRPVQEAGRLHWDSESYAAQTFSHLPDGRVIRAAWNRSPIPGMPFNGSLEFPQELRLCRIDDRLCLCAAPVREIGELYRDTRSFGPAAVEPGRPLSVPLSGRAQDLTLTIRPGAAPVRLSLPGMDLELRPGEDRLIWGERALPMFRREGAYTLRILTDVHSTALYADRGQACLCAACLGGGDGVLRLSAEEAPAGFLALTCHELSGIWDPA